MKVYEGVEIYLHALLTLTLTGGELATSWSVNSKVGRERVNPSVPVFCLDV
jgi:hypothetical protein